MGLDFRRVLFRSAGLLRDETPHLGAGNAPDSTKQMARDYLGRVVQTRLLNYQPLTGTTRTINLETVTLDPVGLVTTKTVAHGNGGGFETDTTYDGAGHTQHETAIIAGAASRTSSVS